MQKLLRRINIVCGHYGSGKTNIAVNMAISASKRGDRAVLVDLDMVNPYFRADDSKEILKKYNVELISPTFANTNVEVMAVPARVNSVFADKSCTVIFDVGGDDAGAVALGMYNSQFMADDTMMFCVINQRRPLTIDAFDSLEVIREIELASRLKCGCIINNTNLGDESSLEVIEQSAKYAQEVKEKSGCKRLITTIRRDIYDGIVQKPCDYYPIDIYTKQLF